MKKFIAIAAVMFLASCKKSNDDLPSSATVTLTAQTGPVISTVQPGTRRHIGSFTLVAAHTQGYSIGYDITLSGTVSLTNIRNVTIVVRSGSDSTTLLPTQAGQGMYSSEWTVLARNATHTVSVYADISAGAIGTLTTTMKGEYGMQNEPSRWTGSISYPTVSVTPYHSMLSFSVSTLQGVIESDVERDFYEVAVTNTGTKRTSISQVTFAASIVDVGGDDNITLEAMKWMVNGSDATTQVTLYNASNGSVLSLLPEGNTKFHVSYTQGSREVGIDPGETVTFRLRGTPKGLVQSGNGMSFQLLTDLAATPSGYNFLRIGAPGEHVRLGNARASGSMVSANFLWSPNATPHSAIPNNSSADFVNGYGYPVFAEQFWHQ